MIIEHGAWLKKQVITSLDAPQEFLSEATREREARSAAQDTALMRALGLAHHWQRLLGEQRAASVAEIAEAEGVDVTQVRRVIPVHQIAEQRLQEKMQDTGRGPENGGKNAENFEVKEKRNMTSFPKRE